MFFPDPNTGNRHSDTIGIIFFCFSSFLMFLLRCFYAFRSFYFCLSSSFFLRSSGTCSRWELLCLSFSLTWLLPFSRLEDWNSSLCVHYCTKVMLLCVSQKTHHQSKRELILFKMSLIVSCYFAFVWKAKVIPVYDGSSDLLSVLMEETGGLGVDIVVDSGGKLFLQIISYLSN